MPHEVNLQVVPKLNETESVQGLPTYADGNTAYRQKRIMFIGEVNDKSSQATIHGYIVDVCECPFDGMSRVLEDPRGYAFCIMGDTALQQNGIDESIWKRFQFDVNQDAPTLKFSTKLFDYACVVRSHQVKRGPNATDAA